MIDESNPDGFFTSQKEKYLKCLDLKYNNLEELFRQDE